MAATSALHRALLDFGEERPWPPRGSAAAAAEPAPVAFCADDLDRAVAQAEARLRDVLEGQHMMARERAVREAVAEALAGERSRHEAEMRQLAVEQAGETAANVAAAIAALRQEVLEEVSAACAALLEPVLSHDAAQRAVAALSRGLREALEDREGIRITLSGPAELRALLRTELSDLSAKWQERDGEGFDLRAAFENHVLETRLGEWAEALKGSRP